MKCEAIGIDFGNNYSCVCVFKDGKITNLPFTNGGIHFPSVVAFTDKECLVGEEAHKQADQNIENTIHCVKRFLGQTVNTSDGRTKLDFQSLPAKSKFSDLVFEVEIGGQKQDVHPQELVAILIQRMKLAAEDYLGHKVKQAVIGVPAAFNNIQRKQMHESAIRAGFETIELINETTAAAIFHRSKISNDYGIKYYIIVCVGGGSFDVSVVSNHGNELKVEATSGNSELGGVDFDQRLMSYVIKEINRLHPGENWSTPQAIRKIATACENAKIILTTKDESQIELGGIIENKILYFGISRSLLENLCSDLIEEIEATINNVIKESKVSSREYHDVVFVGGSTHIPSIKNLLTTYTKYKEIHNKRLIHHHHQISVAFGCMIHSMTITKHPDVPIGNLKLKEITSQSYSMKTKYKEKQIIKRNTTITSNVVESFYPSRDDSFDSITVIYGDETSKKKVIEKFTLSANKETWKEFSLIKATFSFDKNGILVIKAKRTVQNQEVIFKVNSNEEKNPLAYNYLDLEWNGNRGAYKRRESRESMETSNMNEIQQSNTFHNTPSDPIMPSTSKTTSSNEQTAMTKRNELSVGTSTRRRHAVGIDLGTTNSSVGCYRDGKVDIIENEKSKRKTPSVVTFTENKLQVGEALSLNGSRNAKNSIFNSKKYIGRQFSEKQPESSVQYVPYDVETKNDAFVFKVQYRTKERYFSPEEISAMLIKKLKKMGENYFGEEVTDAVITVPSYFNNAQRQATIDAATIAGLDEVQLINETTAAAIAYGFANIVIGRETILVFHMGGGTCDVSIVNIVDGTSFEVKATCGDTNLGGSDFDNKMMLHLTKYFDGDVLDNKKTLHGFRVLCEENKKKISLDQDVQFEIDFLRDSENHSITMSRKKFEDICDELFEKAMDLVTKVMNGAKLKKSDIDKVLLIGGSTRIPKIQSDLEKYFCGKEFIRSINPDEAAVEGATLLSAKLSKSADSRLETLNYQDVTALDIKLKRGDELLELIPQNSLISAIKRNEFVSSKILCELFETDHCGRSSDNCKLGELEIEGNFVNVTFEIDQNGILTASTTNYSTGGKKLILIKTPKKPFTMNEMINKAYEIEKENEEYRDLAEAKNNLEEFVLKAQRFCKANQKKMNPHKLSSAESACSNALRKMESPDVERYTIVSELENLKDLITPWMINYS